MNKNSTPWEDCGRCGGSLEDESYSHKNGWVCGECADILAAEEERANDGTFNGFLKSDNEYTV